MKVLIVALPMSISGLQEQKLEVPLVGKKKQVEGENPVQMLGKVTCAAKLTPSTGQRSFLWLRE